MFKWIKNNKLQSLTILTVVGNICSVISALAILAVPPVGLHYLALGIVALGMCTISLLGIIMFIQRDRMFRRFEVELRRANEAEQRSLNLEDQAATAQESFQDKLAQKDALRTSDLAALQDDFGKQESLWEKERGSFHTVLKTGRGIAADASEVLHVLRDCDSEEKLADANRRVDRFMEDCADWSKQTFEALWGDDAPCRVLVKYLVDENNMCLMFRDRQTGRVEKGAQRRRRIDQYTSYGDVYHGRRRYFFSHDLVALAKNGNYSNPKENWQDLYKTELVVPIGKLDTSDGCGRDLVGFLAIASLKTHIMDEKRDRDIAFTIASHMYDVLARLDDVKRAHEQECKGGAVKQAPRGGSRKGDSSHASA